MRPVALLLTPDPLVAAGLRSLLGELGWDAIDDPWSGAGRDADAALWDADDPRSDPEFVAEFVAEAGAPVVALVSGSEGAARALAAGAVGALHRGAEPELVDAALRAVAVGLEVRDPAVAPREPTPDGPLEPLTSREREVLELVVEGLANPAIAARLGVSPSTVKFHLATLFGKFGVRGRTELAVAAVRAGVAFV